MDTKTIIAFAMMILIYIFFFQSPPQQHLDGAAATNAVESVQPAASPGTTAQVAAKTQDDVSALKEKIFWLENEKIRVSVDGLGSVREAVFSKYEKEIGKADSVDSIFSPGVLNQSFITTSMGQPKWSKVVGDKSTLNIEGSVADISILRRVELLPDSYVLKVTDSFTNRGAQSSKANVLLKLAHPPIPDAPEASFLAKIFMPQAELHEVVWDLDGSVSREPFQGFSAAVQYNGNISWAGYGHKYFFYGLTPENISIASLKIENQKEVGLTQEFALTEKALEIGKTSEYSYKIYIGPKVLPELQTASEELTEVVDYGSWIGPIARLLLTLLHMFYKIIPNYGIGIILLTLLVKLVLYPLAYKSAVSMRKLQVVQPKMKDIRDRYKGDKQRMNAEMMALYRTEKVNPVGGCLPILLQMPVFFALYRVFFTSIEFRHAPFFGWIKDLSVHDPYFVTPVLMTVLMWYQTKLTPQPPAMEENEAVAAQRAMMKWMPIIFGAIMIFLPSGLTLYFLINALLSLLQQLYLNKHLATQFPLAAKAV